MAGARKFDEGQWRTLQFAPLWTFGFVASADGRVTRSEFISTSAMLRSGLAREVVVSAAGEFDACWKAFQEDTRTPDRGLRDVAGLLERVPHDEAAMFKYTLIGLGLEVAKRSRRLRVKRVSNAEKMAVEVVRQNLDLDPADVAKVAANYEADPGFASWGAGREGAGGYL